MKNILLVLLTIFLFSCQEKTKKPINQIDGTTSSKEVIEKTVIPLPYPDSLFETFEMTEGDIIG